MPFYSLERQESHVLQSLHSPVKVQQVRPFPHSWLFAFSLLSFFCREFLLKVLQLSFKSLYHVFVAVFVLVRLVCMRSESLLV